MAEGVPIGKRMVCTASCLFPPALIRLRRPLSPVCALGTSPKRGSALRGEVGGGGGERFALVHALGAPFRGAGKQYHSHYPFSPFLPGKKRGCSKIQPTKKEKALVL